MCTTGKPGLGKGGEGKSVKLGVRFKLYSGLHYP